MESETCSAVESNRASPSQATSSQWWTVRAVAMVARMTPPTAKAGAHDDSAGALSGWSSSAAARLLHSKATASSSAASRPSGFSRGRWGSSEKSPGGENDCQEHRGGQQNQHRAGAGDDVAASMRPERPLRPARAEQGGPHRQQQRGDERPGVFGDLTGQPEDFQADQRGQHPPAARVQPGLELGELRIPPPQERVVDGEGPGPGRPSVAIERMVPEPPAARPAPYRTKTERFRTRTEPPPTRPGLFRACRAVSATLGCGPRESRWRPRRRHPGSGRLSHPKSRRRRRTGRSTHPFRARRPGAGTNRSRTATKPGKPSISDRRRSM